MSYDVTSVRIWSQQTANRIFNEVAAGGTSGNSSSSSAPASLADMLFTKDDDSTDDDDTRLSALLASLRNQVAAGDAAVDDNSDGAVEDISSKAFMKALDEKLTSLSENPDTKAMAEAMRKAIAAGKLTVTDAEEGEQIRAWAVSDEKAVPTKITAAATSDWSAFLKEHLARDATGSFARNDDSSHKDKITGASSYFGTIADNYYYLSWVA